MRERHNIVGSEVGRPRPPFYARSHTKLQIMKPYTNKRWITLSLVGAGCLGLIVVAVG